MSERSERTNKHGLFVGCGACGAAVSHLSADTDILHISEHPREAL